MLIWKLDIYDQVKQIWVARPARRTINIDGRRMFLSFPTMLFKIEAARNNNRLYPSYVRVTFCEGSPKETDRIYFVPLPNVRCVELSVCMPTSYKVKSFPSIDEMTREAIDSFWSSAFYPKEMNHTVLWSSPLSDWNWWQRRTALDPTWVPDKEVFIDPAFIGPGGSLEARPTQLAEWMK